MKKNLKKIGSDIPETFPCQGALAPFGYSILICGIDTNSAVFRVGVKNDHLTDK